jgi:hypothetical protein
LEDEFDDAEEGAPECDPDDICEILDTFLKKREAQRNAVDNFGNPQVKKKSDFEDEEQEHERQKREEKHTGIGSATSFLIVDTLFGRLLTRP